MQRNSSKTFLTKKSEGSSDTSEDFLVFYWSTKTDDKVASIMFLESQGSLHVKASAVTPTLALLLGMLINGISFQATGL